MLTKQELIAFIRENDATYNDKPLEKYSIESLVIFKVQIELAHHRQHVLKTLNAVETIKEE